MTYPPLTYALLTWYDKNKRALPWRETRDPYAIVVSEFMLQQTRVEAVLPKYIPFLHAFPTLSSLAKAQEEEILALWQGLGYYTRARRLGSLAKEVTKTYQGAFPTTYEEFLALPGIGEYTAGAVLSIAFGLPVLAIDGNVLRVASRVFAVLEDISKQKTKKQIHALLYPYLPKERPGDFNQAIMDLGAFVCIPKTPRCEECPLLSFCQARRRGMEYLLPKKKSPTPPKKVSVFVLLLETEEGLICLRKRSEGQFLRGLWELPWIERASLDTTVAITEEEGAQDLPSSLTPFLTATPEETLHSEYIFTHRHWLMTIERHLLSEAFSIRDESKTTSYLFFKRDHLPKLGIATAFKKLLAP